jgi:hypothetical protein
MPVSRNLRVWITMLAALGALFAFAPQAGAEYDESDEPVEGCVAHDYGDEDSCWEEEDEPASDEGESEESDDEPDVCFARGDYEDLCSEDEPDLEELKDEPEADAPKEESDYVRPCEDGPVARGARSERDEVKFEDGCLPNLVRRFVSRVWKFVGEVDYYEEGVLSMTLGKIRNLPRRWRSQDDELLDQDTTVLVSQRVRVFLDGRRVSRDELDNANDVRVHGKLLRPEKWHADEDGEPVTTIRAKKVYVTG